MTESLKIIATRLHLDMTGIYVWLDILSITQQKQKLKALAVNSLCTYASQADAMIIVAPDSQHHNQKILANLQTYKCRVWTRAEQVSFFTKSGASKMFIITENFGEVPEGWMADVAALFEGDMTCCARKHQGGGPCDKESLVLPMLGMYFNGSIEWSARNFQRKQSSPSTTETHLNQNEFVYELTSTQKLSMFPQTHDYMTPSGKVIKQELFGKSIVLVDHILVKKQENMRAIHAAALVQMSQGVANDESHCAAHSNQQCIVPAVAPCEMPPRVGIL